MFHRPDLAQPISAHQNHALIQRQWCYPWSYLTSELDDQMLNTHIPHGPEATKSPHIHIHKSFHCIQDNSIILYSPIEKGNGTSRKIYYERVEFGKKVQYSAKKFINLHPENTTNYMIVITNERY